MAKRKPMDEARWAWVTPEGDIVVAGRKQKRNGMFLRALPQEEIIRVRVTEVPKKKRSKKR